MVTDSVCRWVSWSLGRGDQRKVVAGCFTAIWVCMPCLGGDHDMIPSWGNMSWLSGAGGGHRWAGFAAWVVGKVAGNEFSSSGQHTTLLGWPSTSLGLYSPSSHVGPCSLHTSLHCPGLASSSPPVSSSPLSSSFMSSNTVRTSPSSFLPFVLFHIIMFMSMVASLVVIMAISGFVSLAGSLMAAWVVLGVIGLYLGVVGA